MSEDMTDPNDIKEVMEEDKNMAPDELSKRYNERYKRKMAMMAKMVSFVIYSSCFFVPPNQNNVHYIQLSRDYIFPVPP